MKKYFQLYKMSLNDHFSEPGKTFIWILVGATRAFTFAFIWLLASGGKEQIGALSVDQLVSYYIFSFFIYYIIGGVFHHLINQAVKSGEFSNFLLKPIFPYSKAILHEQAWKTFGLITSIPLMAMLLFVFRDFLYFDLSFSNLLVTFPAVVLGMFSFAAAEFIIGNLVYWVQDVNSIKRIHYTLNDILGGFLIPFILLPEWLKPVTSILPFRYTFSFAIEIFQNQLNNDEILLGFAVQTFWLLVLFLICQWIYSVGLEKYEAFGN